MKRLKTQLAFETLEIRRCLAASVGWDGPGQGAATLTYSVGKVPEGLNQNLVETTIADALKVWSDVADIKFVPTAQTGLANSIDFSFASIDGPGGTLAQANLPDDINSRSLAGDVQFDVAEQWERGDELGNQAFDLLFVAVHEIGHALGLEHSHGTGSVLSDTVSPRQQFNHLASSDVDAVRNLYAPAIHALPSVQSTVDKARNFTRIGSGQPWILVANLAPHFHLAFPGDVNRDGFLSPIDALLVINHLNDFNVANDTGAAQSEGPSVDCNGDGDITPIDALYVINRLNQGLTAPQLVQTNLASITLPRLNLPIDSEIVDLIDRALPDVDVPSLLTSVEGFVNNVLDDVDSIFNDIDTFLATDPVSNLVDSLLSGEDENGDGRVSLSEFLGSLDTGIRNFVNRIL